MSQIDASRMLTELRSMAAAAGQITERIDEDKTSISFSSMLAEAVNSVNASQQKASALAEAFELGAPGVNLAEVVVAAQKASISFQAMLQVRNKLVTAYQEIMNMPV